MKNHFFFEKENFEVFLVCDSFDFNTKLVISLSQYDFFGSRETLKEIRWFSVQIILLSLFNCDQNKGLCKLEFAVSGGQVSLQKKLFIVYIQDF